MEDCGFGVRPLALADVISDEPMEVDYFAMSLCVSGKASVTVNLDRYDIALGDMLFLSPKDYVHYEMVSEDFAMKQIYITSMELIREAATHILPFMRDVESSRAFFLSEKDSYSKGRNAPAAFHTIYNFLSMLLANPETSSQYEQGVCLFRCLFLMMRDRSSLHYRQNTTEQKGTSLGYFNRFMLLLSEHCKEHHEVGYYAAELHVTAQYLGRICKKHDGRGAKEIINETLILQMKSAIKNTELTMKEVSYEYNFPNFSAMSRFFRHHTGQTPSQFRAQYRTT